MFFPFLLFSYFECQCCHGGCSSPDSQDFCFSFKRANISFISNQRCLNLSYHDSSDNLVTLKFCHNNNNIGSSTSSSLVQNVNQELVKCRCCPGQLATEQQLCYVSTSGHSLNLQQILICLCHCSIVRSKLCSLL